LSDAQSPETRPGTVHRHKARREHACAECDEPIKPGDSYMFLNTFDRGKWSRYVLCGKCERIRSCHSIAVLALGREDLSYASGQMRNDVRELCRHERGYSEEFKAAWAASEAIFIETERTSQQDES